MCICNKLCSFNQCVDYYNSLKKTALNKIIFHSFSFQFLFQKYFFPKILSPKNLPKIEKTREDKRIPVHILKSIQQFITLDKKSLSNSVTTVFKPTNNISLESQWGALYYHPNRFTKKWKTKKKNEEEKNNFWTEDFRF